MRFLLSALLVLLVAFRLQAQETNVEPMVEGPRYIIHYLDTEVGESARVTYHAFRAEIGERGLLHQVEYNEADEAEIVVSPYYPNVYAAVRRTDNLSVVVLKVMNAEWTEVVTEHVITSEMLGAEDYTMDPMFFEQYFVIRSNNAESMYEQYTWFELLPSNSLQEVQHVTLPDLVCINGWDIQGLNMVIGCTQAMYLLHNGEFLPISIGEGHKSPRFCGELTICTYYQTGSNAYEFAVSSLITSDDHQRFPMIGIVDFIWGVYQTPVSPIGNYIGRFHGQGFTLLSFPEGEVILANLPLKQSFAAEDDFYWVTYSEELYVLENGESRFLLSGVTTIKAAHQVH